MCKWGTCSRPAVWTGPYLPDMSVSPSLSFSHPVCHTVVVVVVVVVVVTQESPSPSPAPSTPSPRPDRKAERDEHRQGLRDFLAQQRRLKAKEQQQQQQDGGAEGVEVKTPASSAAAPSLPPRPPPSPPAAPIIPPPPPPAAGERDGGHPALPPPSFRVYRQVRPRGCLFPGISVGLLGWLVATCRCTLWEWRDPCQQRPAAAPPPPRERERASRWEGWRCQYRPADGPSPLTKVSEGGNERMTEWPHT